MAATEIACPFLNKIPLEIRLEVYEHALIRPVVHADNTIHKDTIQAEQLRDRRAEMQILEFKFDIDGTIRGALARHLLPIPLPRKLQYIACTRDIAQNVLDWSYAMMELPILKTSAITLNIPTDVPKMPIEPPHLSMQKLILHLILRIAVGYF
ncbi:MAG: hypothetical protein M1827_005447 [Pycnora praestabilis]|nr:MAG: hypothetical protein M1827_005447 [Pycnora praestabilis]